MNEEAIAKLTQDLRELEEQLTEGQVPVRALADLREAIDHIRHAIWALLNLRHEGEAGVDTFAILESLTVDRLRRAAKLNQEILLDIDAGEVTVSTDGLAEFQRTAQNLHYRLQRLSSQGV
jgi:hypothetical protein